MCKISQVSPMLRDNFTGRKGSKRAIHNMAWAPLLLPSYRWLLARIHLPVFLCRLGWHRSSTAQTSSQDPNAGHEEATASLGRCTYSSRSVTPTIDGTRGCNQALLLKEIVQAGSRIERESQLNGYTPFSVSKLLANAWGKKICAGPLVFCMRFLYKLLTLFRTRSIIL